MQFDVKGVNPGEALERFKTDWVNATAEENKLLHGEDYISSAQILVIDLFCGHDYPYKGSDELVISTNQTAQGELEALFRGRQIALTKFFKEQMR